MADAHALLDEYDRMSEVYRSYAAKIGMLLTDLLVESDLVVHSVSHRLKSRESFRRKVSRTTATYASLSDVTDLAGVRVTCFFADDVDVVARLIEREFQIDVSNTVDKRQLIDPDRFGYLSLHHIVQLRADRSALTEYRKFPNLKAEVQTRSILQHAWAEIEHDLGYKASGEVPRHIRRRFSRVASLLELADQEFSGIRDELALYERALPDDIRAVPEQVLLDLASLTTFVRNEPLVTELDREILAGTAATVSDLEDMSYIMRRVELASLRSIGEIKHLLDSRRGTIVRFAKEVFKVHAPEAITWYPPGFSITVATYVFLLETRGKDALAEYMKAANPLMSLETAADAYVAATA